MFVPKKNLSPSLLTNSGTIRLVGMHAIPIMTMFQYTDFSISSLHSVSGSILNMDTISHIFVMFFGPVYVFSYHRNLFISSGNHNINM